METYVTGRKNVMVTFVILLCLSLTKASNHTELDLHKLLFENYNPNVLPNKNTSTPIVVNIGLYVVSIDNIDEKRQSMTIRATLGAAWTDEFLTWDPEQYTDVTKINVKNQDIWTPDIALKHTFDRPTDIGQSGGRASIGYKGSVRIWPTKLFTVACKIYIAKFPFDKQTCSYIFVPWTNSANSIMLKSSFTKLDLSGLSESGAWDIIDTNTEEKIIPFENEPYSYVYFTIKLQRKALYHVINEMVPVMCISLLNIAGFILPSHGGERVTLSISLFLTLAVFLTVVNSSMPESSDEVSALSVYVGLQLFGSAFAVTFTIISLTLFHRDDRIAVSSFFKILVRFCGVSTAGQDDSLKKYAERVYNGKSLDKCNGGITWIMVSLAVDRFCLISAVLWHVLLTTSLMLSLNV